MKLIVGLGNPGRSYAGNRHNIGFMCLAYLARSHSVRLDRSRGLARIGSGVIEGEPVVLARPQTYMNLSGESVARLCHYFKLTPAEVIVIHDELDLPVAQLRLKQGGGSGGHKGISSIAYHLGSPDFVRFRVGISRPPDTEGDSSDKDEAVIQHVLSDFSAEENAAVSNAIPEVGLAVEVILSQGLEAAMNRFN